MGSFETIKIKKTLGERKNDFSRILKTFQTCPIGPGTLPLNEVWTYYLECSVEPRGWTAYWKVPRKICTQFGVPFPLEPITVVKDTDFRQMTASITVMYLQEEIEDQFPSSFSGVNLKDLHPTKEQENMGICLESTAESLDQLRIFYNYLWHPWDTDNKLSINDWLDNLMEPRLRLYYWLIESGDCNYGIKDKIWDLLKHGREVHEEIQELLEPSMEFEHERYMMLSTELQAIKFKMDSFENQKHRKEMEQIIAGEKIIDEKGICLVIPESHPRVFSQILAKANAFMEPQTKIRIITQDLQNALYKCFPNDTILLANGVNYGVNRFGNLVQGGSLIGVPHREEDRPVIFDLEPPRALIEFCSKNMDSTLLLKNIHLEIRLCQNAIMVVKGKLEMENVLLSHTKKVIDEGVVVCKDASLVAKGCEFYGFRTAFICFPGSSIKLENCLFTRNSVCVKLVGNANLDMEDCNMTDNEKTVMRA